MAANRVIGKYLWNPTHRPNDWTFGCFKADDFRIRDVRAGIESVTKLHDITEGRYVHKERKFYANDGRVFQVFSDYSAKQL